MMVADSSVRKLLPEPHYTFHEDCIARHDRHPDTPDSIYHDTVGCRSSHPEMKALQAQCIWGMSIRPNYKHSSSYIDL